MHPKSTAIIPNAVLAALLTAGTSTAMAADYTVQIGAFGSAPEKSFTRAAGEYGEVTVNDSGDGVTRVSVGRYATRDEAVSALTRLQIAGYNDAYVTNVLSGSNASVSSQTAAAKPATAATIQNNAQTTAGASTPAPAPSAAVATQAASTSASQAGRFRLRTHDTQSGQTTDLQVSQTGVAGGPPAVVAGVGADKVPPHLRNKLVYLDGVPHIKEGDQFIPIDAASDKP